MSFEKHSTHSAIPPDPTAPLPTPLPTRHPLEGVGRVALPGEVELRNRAYCFTGLQWLAALAAVFLPLLLLVVVVLGTLASVSEGTDPRSVDELVGELRTGVWQELSRNAAELVAFGLTAILSALGFSSGLRERLYVGPDGIRYFSGRPRWLGPLEGSWSVPADQIRDMRVAPPIFGTALHLVQLEVATDRRTHRLGIFSFVDLARYEPKTFRVLTRLRKDEPVIADLFDEMPLVELARRAGYDLRLPDLPRPGVEAQVSLKEKPRLAVAVVLMLVGFSYAVIDMGAISETYAAGAPIALILLGGACVGALAWPLIGASELSRGARANVAGLLALTAMGALYPGLIRINRIGAPEPTAHSYRHNEDHVLEPVEPSSPELEAPYIVERLVGSQPGDVHQLWIRRGSLGFDQIDIDALDHWIRELETRSS
jgi:hypothetical protein